MYPRISCFSDEICPDFAQQLARVREAGLHAIEIRGVNGKNISKFSLEEAGELKKQLDEAGIIVSSIGSPIGKIAINDEFAPHYNAFQHVVRLAHALGTPFIRVFGFFIPEEEDAESRRDEVMRRMEAMVRLADKEKVTLLHENEKHIYADTAPRCADLMEQFYGPHFKAVFDPANFVQCGQETLEAYGLMKPYIGYVHIKDALWANGENVPCGWGDGHVPELLGKLQDSGYEGFLSVEPHLADFQGFGALEKDGVKAPLDGDIAFRTALDALLSALYRLGWN